jgi:hypothetical protein
MNLLKPGDVVDVDGNVTYPSLAFTAAGTSTKPILIRGQTVNGKRPVIQGYAQTSGLAALKFIGSNHVIFESFEITNGPSANPKQTSACVFNEANDVTLRRVTVRDCPNHGILGADSGSGSLTLEEVEVTRSGCNANLNMTCNGVNLKHPIYVATDPSAYPGATLRIVNSYVHDNRAGEGIKTRAERVQVYFNWLESSAKQDRNLGLYGYQDFEAGVDAPVIHHDIVGNIIVERGSSSMMRTGGDATGSTRGRTRFVNNTVILDASFGSKGKPVIRLDGDLESFEAHNNVFYVVSSNEDIELLRENDNLNWIGAGGKPRVLVTHTNLGTGSTYLRTQDGTNYNAASLPSLSSGYRFENLTTHTPGFITAQGLENLNLQLIAGSPLRGLGTTATNAAGYEIPWCLAVPLREPIAVSPGEAIVVGALRPDGAAPTLGAYP